MGMVAGATAVATAAARGAVAVSEEQLASYSVDLAAPLALSVATQQILATEAQDSSSSKAVDAYW